MEEVCSEGEGRGLPPCFIGFHSQALVIQLLGQFICTKQKNKKGVNKQIANKNLVILFGSASRCPYLILVKSNVRGGTLSLAPGNQSIPGKKATLKLKQSKPMDPTHWPKRLNKRMVEVGQKERKGGKRGGRNKG